MELDDQMIKVGSEMKTSVGLQIELERHISKWRELKESGEKFLLEINKGISNLESLTNKFTSLEADKIRIENEIKVLKKGNTNLDNKVTKFDKEDREKGVVDWTYDEEDTVTCLMIENKMLECEKKAAESMVEDLKLKCQRLEMENSALIERKIFFDKYFNFGLDVKSNSRNSQHEKAHRMGIGNLEEGTPSNKMASEEYTQVEKSPFPFEAATCNRRRVKKQLKFVEEESPRKKISPTTPGIQRPSNCVVDISDSEDDPEHSTHVHSSRVGSLNSDRGSEDGLTNCSFASTHKRKRASNIVASDSESNDDYDNIPISNLRNEHLQSEATDDLDNFNLIDGVKECSPPRRRLTRKCVENAPQRNSPSNSHEDYRSEGEEEDEDEDNTYSITESETLGGFIVSGSDISEKNDDCSVSHEVADDGADFEEVISNIKRKRENKVLWEFEADMLADFGKDIELCMKAVCALYRQQTADEMFSKSTICLNQRGFSQCDALRGSDLADFICDGDPDRDICKSAEELQKYDSKAPELCRTLATHYSKQLFAIYKNKEDPFFSPLDNEHFRCC